MQSVKATNLFDWMARRPPKFRLNGPYPAGDINQGLVGNDTKFKSNLQVVSENLEGNVPNSNGTAEHHSPGSKLILKYLFVLGVLKKHRIYTLLARFHKGVRPATHIVGDWTQAEPNNVSWWRLFDRVEASIFRHWYRFTATVNLLKHECGFNRPRRK